MESFSDWWSGLSVMLKVYWALAIPFTIIFVLQVILSFFGGDTADDLPDAEVSADHGIGFQFFTLKNFIGFFTIFGWAGIAMIESGASNGVSVFVATLAGTLMMFMMAGMFYLLMKAQHDGTMKIEKAIGQTGEVYLTIQSKRGGIGKVQVMVTGALRTLDALTDDETDIQTGKIVRVSNVVNNNILLVTSK
ncbi:MAG TPA: hypothetical protein VFE50_11020 [Cyclobacteriaceae bacterium]|nr:hypothetical protein [Cyclobacteriaceae bacterium]